jgi:hypothetical protein
MKADNRRGWRNWGDHPLIVASGIVGVTFTIIGTVFTIVTHYSSDARTRLVTAVFIVALSIGASAQDDAVLTTNQFELRVRPVAIHVPPNLARGVEARVSVQIRNLGWSPVEIALVVFAQGQPLLQVDGGPQFTLPNGRAVSGLALCNSNQPAVCERSRGDFTALPSDQTVTGLLTLFASVDKRDVGSGTWGSLSATLFVRDVTGGRARMDPLTVQNIAVVNRVR